MTPPTDRDSGLASCLKATLVVCGILFALGAGAVLFGVSWWRQNKGRLMESARAAHAEGEELGRTADTQGCLDASVVRLRQDGSLPAAVRTNLFLAACLAVARPSPRFCEGVPAPTDFLKSIEWRTRRCQEMQVSPNTCGQLLAVVQTHCQRGTPPR
jgi:hypothetical protein